MVSSATLTPTAMPTKYGPSSTSLSDMPNSSHMLLGTPEGMHDEEEVGLRIAGREGVREGVLVVDTNSGGRWTTGYRW